VEEWVLKVGARITEDGVNMEVEVVDQLVTVENPLDMGAVRYLAHQAEEAEQAIAQVPLVDGLVVLEDSGDIIQVMEA